MARPCSPSWDLRCKCNINLSEALFPVRFRIGFSAIVWSLQDGHSGFTGTMRYLFSNSRSTISSVASNAP